MSGWGWFILVLILLIPITAFAWIGYSRLKAQRAGREPPPLSSYIPWKRNRHADAYPAPSGVVAWVRSKIQGSGSRSGAYEQPLGPGARRGLDPDEAWDARVGAEADGYGAGGYYEEQELGLRPPASGAYTGGGYGGGNQALPDYGEERGRSISRAGGPHIAGGQKGLDERYDEEMGHEDPFGDEAERSELRGVSPRPHEEGKGHATQVSGDGPHDDSPTERRSMFHENVDKIYFDGYLPMRKRDIRIQRLNDSLTILKKFIARNSNGSENVHESCESGPATSSHVFKAGSPTPTTFHGMIAPPFLVPALLDAIFCSKYAAVSAVVPGEADVYCAKAARDGGGTILTNDSDLFVHDLGSHGALSLIHQTELRPNEEEGNGEQATCQTVSLLMLRPKEIAERLGLVDLQRLAYVLSRTREVLTLPKAIARAKEHRDIGLLPFREFLEEYATETSITESQTFSPDSLANYFSYAQPLDPRVSELMLQFQATSQDTVYMYLPNLIDDLRRSSAWQVSTEQRAFAYSIPNHLHNRQHRRSRPIILECRRSGDRILAEQILTLQPDNLRVHYGELLAKIHDFVSTFADYPQPVIWRAYALEDVYRWYLNNSKPPPSREAMTRLMTGPSEPSTTWEDMHLSAQVQAVLYTLRMTQQILTYTIHTTKTGPSKLRRELAAMLSSLPPMAHLMPPRSELAAGTSSMPETETCGLDHLLDLLAVRLQKEANAEGAVGRCGGDA